MKLPERVLRQVRGPVLAAAVAGCSTSPAATGEPEPLPGPEAAEHATAEPAAATVAPDPVDYDAETEAERLARLDRTMAAGERRRDERIEDEAAARRRERAGSQNQVIGIGTIGHRWPGGVHPACGRG
jgi:hypothetical protein